MGVRHSHRQSMALQRSPELAELHTLRFGGSLVRGWRSKARKARCRGREVDVRMPLPRRLGGVTAICGGGLTIASTYLVAWGFWVDPLEVPTRGSDTLAQLSEHMGGWFGMATAVMTAGGALLV